MNHFTDSESEFNQRALNLFRQQARHNEVYRQFLEILKADPQSIDDIRKIPFMPIQLFKHNIIKTGVWDEQNIFLSSGTTLQTRSRHYVRDEQKYLNNAVSGFSEVFGNPADWVFIAYLPGYTENPSSSLISMVNELVRLSRHELSGFVAFDPETLNERLEQAKQTDRKIMLIGVAFALVDFAVTRRLNFPSLYILETGGMKGRSENLTRKDLHSILSEGFGTTHVYAEYGMTELFSQAYSREGSFSFIAMPGMKVLVKDMNDPMEIRKAGRYGVLHIIDLANEDTCAFIATQDIGMMHADGSFDVIGRIDTADLRGCNLLYIAPE